MTLNVQFYKEKARFVMKNRSLLPDIQYIFFAAFLSLTIVGLPIAYLVIQEYHKYLITCIEEYETNLRHKKGAVYPHTSIYALNIDYKWSNASKAIKRILTLVLVGYSCLNFDNLSDKQNANAKITLDSVKLLFPMMHIYQFSIPLIILLLIIPQPSIVIYSMVAFVIIETILVIRPFITYCHTFVMYERTHSTMASESEIEKAEIDAFFEKLERENKK